jgi:hypothetical protein
MCGVETSLNHMATAILIVRVVIAVVVIIVVRVGASVAESEAVPEVAVVESASADFLRSAVAVSPSLRASFVSWALLGRLSPPAKIPFPGQVGRSRLGANVVS